MRATRSDQHMIGLSADPVVKTHGSTKGNPTTAGAQVRILTQGTKIPHAEGIRVEKIV